MSTAASHLSPPAHEYSPKQSIHSGESRAWSIHREVLEVAGTSLVAPLRLSLKAGHLYLISGPNGSGKSSLLRAIAFELSQDASLMAGQWGLRDELTLEQHVMALSALYPPQSENGADTQVCMALQALQLESCLKQRIGHLSSGQKAKLAWCSMLASQRPLLLLDEPLNALDSASIRWVQSTIQDQLRAGTCIVVTSHIDIGLLWGEANGATGVPFDHLEIREGALHRVGAHALQNTGELICQKVDLIRPVEHQVEQLHTPPDDTHGLAIDSAPDAQNGAQRLSLALFFGLMRREMNLLHANPQSLLWSGLFYWMVLSFMGLSLGAEAQAISRALVWISALLAIILFAKDWFSEDERADWLTLICMQSGNTSQLYWIAKVLTGVFSVLLTLLPISMLAALQFNLTVEQLMSMLLSLGLGVWAIAPVLGLISLMALLTRGGAVLVYVLAIPLVLPVLVFGLEGSVCMEFGRSPFAPWMLLLSMGGLGLLLGGAISKQLMRLIQE